MRPRDVPPETPTRKAARRRRCNTTQPCLPVEGGRRRPDTLRQWVLSGRSEELDDAEILAVVLGSTGASQATLRLARTLITRGLLARDRPWVPQGVHLRALGSARAARLLAALELAHRLHPPPAGVTPHQRPIETPRQVYEWARSYAQSDREHFLVLHLNTRHVPRKLDVISIGSLNASIVHPREVFRNAIREATAALILVHNHPSGDPAPSRDDVTTTDRLVKVGQLVGIHVLDHVILAGDRFFSFREEGLMPAHGQEPHET